MSQLLLKKITEKYFFSNWQKAMLLDPATAGMLGLGSPFGTHNASKPLSLNKPEPATGHSVHHALLLPSSKGVAGLQAPARCIQPI